jgi:hypothetical protein
MLDILLLTTDEIGSQIQIPPVFNSSPGHPFGELLDGAAVNGAMRR